MSKIEVVLAAATDKLALQNMMQLYVHDFTESDLNNDAWDGAILRFQIRPLPAT